MYAATFDTASEDIKSIISRAAHTLDGSSDSICMGHWALAMLRFGDVQYWTQRSRELPYKQVGQQRKNLQDVTLQPEHYAQLFQAHLLSQLNFNVHLLHGRLLTSA